MDARSVAPLLALSLCGCAHGSGTRVAIVAPPPSRVAAPARPGESTRPYAGVPYYMEPPEPPVEVAVGRWDERVPVAGRGPSLRGATTAVPRIDDLRLRLAAIDTVAIHLRHGATTSDSVDDLERDADTVAQLVSPRPDLAAEAGELRTLAHHLRAMRPGLHRDATLRRLGELTDLIRLQLDAS